MDLKSLIAKMDQLSEAPAVPAAGSMSRSDYDKFKAEDARKAAIEQIKKLAATPLNQIPRLGDAIDPKTGIIYYGEADGLSADIGKPRKMPYDWMMRGPNTDTGRLTQLLKTAGLEVVPHEEKTLFGTAKYAKVEPEQLANIDKVPEPETTTSPCAEKIAKLKELIAQLKQQKATPAPAPNVQVKENTISENLISDFIYNYDEQLNEWSTQDTIDTARGAYQGLTFGAGDNITAGVKSAFGQDTYAQALAKEQEKTAAARARSPSVKFTDPVFNKEWNPSAFDAAELVGAVAVPIPGVGIAGQAAARGTKAALKAAPTAAKVAAPVARVGTELAGTYAALKGAEHVLKGHNLATQIKASGGDLTVAKAQDALGFTGGDLDGRVGPLTTTAVKLFQQDQKLPITGKLDPATLSALGVQ